jgi:hypothetical protein
VKSSEDIFDNLIQWMTEKGAKFDRFGVQSRGGIDRFAVAKEDIPKDTIFLTVPLELIITLNHCLQSPVGKILYANQKSFF